MGNYINKKTLLDGETGEVLKEKTWVNYDGFTEEGYAYRPRSSQLRYFPDSIPDNLTEYDWSILIMMAEIMNDENVLVQRVKRKSKFNDTIYMPLTKDEIRERLRFKVGQNRFMKSWYHLRKHCIKKIKYHDAPAWCINPAVVMKSRYLPIWLYAEFYQYLDPYLSPTALKKIKARMKQMQDDEIDLALIAGIDNRLYTKNRFI